MLERMARELGALEDAGGLRRLPTPDYPGGTADGLLNLSSNDYLGLTGDRELRRTFLEALTVDAFRPSAASSRLLTGNSREYAELEELLAALYGTEAALVFNSGYHMNLGIPPAIADAGTLFLADKLVHASLVDGLRLVRGKFLRFRHNDYDHLEAIIAGQRAKYATIVVVTESVFSMDGDEADLDALARLKRRYPEVVLYVDEAHAVGVRGPRGLGCAEERGRLADIDILAGTFGKALASLGGFIVCRKVLRDYLVNTMRPLIYTTGLPPVNLRWTRHVLDRLEQLGDRRSALGSTAKRLRHRLADMGYPALSSSHIIPVVLGGNGKATDKAASLRKAGFHVLPIRPPTVPAGTARLRLSLTADVTTDDVDRLAANL